jgi:hypothetical protein
VSLAPAEVAAEIPRRSSFGPLADLVTLRADGLELSLLFATRTVVVAATASNRRRPTIHATLRERNRTPIAGLWRCTYWDMVLLSGSALVAGSLGAR